MTTGQQFINIVNDISENHFEIEIKDWARLSGPEWTYSEFYNAAVREPQGLPPRAPMGFMCVSCGAIVAPSGMLPCDH